MPCPPDTQRRGLGTTLLGLWLLANTLNSSANAQQQQHDVNHINRGENAASYASDVRALAPYAPVERLSDAVRAPAKSPAPSGGLGSRFPARSLQDWKVEDVILLATVDGMIHAANRNTGEELWSLEADKAMVETQYYPQNWSYTGPVNDPSANEFIWIVEPSQDGQLYGYTPGMSLGMQRLGLTVKQLVEELSPHSSDDPPVVYTGEKKNTLYTVDIASGKILKSFSASQSSVNPDQDTCRRVGELDALDDDECGAVGTLTLTRTEYIVGITSRITGDQISTIRYSEWGPNNRDKDLFQQYSLSKGNRYIHSKHNGEILALDNAADGSIPHRPMFKHKFASPVARTFDVAKPLQHTHLETPLVILPQPLNPSFDFTNNQIFVNCTNNGSWYALSEIMYPLVTAGAGKAQCTQEDWIFTLAGPQDTLQSKLRQSLVGVHAISEDQLPSRVPLIGGTETRQTLDGPDSGLQPLPLGDPPAIPPGRLPTDAFDYGYGHKLAYTFLLFLGTVCWVLWYKRGADPRVLSLISRARSFGTFPDATSVKPHGPAALLNSHVDELATPKALHDRSDPFEKAQEGPTANDSAEKEQAEQQKPKKKAHRGKRGGKRDAEKKGLKPAPGEEELESVLQEGKENVSVKPDIIYQSKSAAEGANSGLLNLEIRSDAVLGSGSAGTIVFAGQFEGRDVAVKRMLGQYTELASQEVSLLEQSEDHPNVIRYFCRRQDEHFLYIALELCQASLWDLFRDGHVEDVAEKYHSIRAEISFRPDRVLRQLAEGLKHLHTFRIVHRDIKPQNMLIAYPKKHMASTFPRFVISDFGLCKTLPAEGSTILGATISAGTTGWKAPELITQPRDTTNGATHSTGRDSSNGESYQGIKRAVDIFSMGCVFFYVFTGGKHPFDDDEGWTGLREKNIKANKCNLSELEKYQSYDIKDLIAWMLSPRPEDRPTAAEVLSHPFFWSAEEKLEFLSLASDRFDVEARDGTSASLKALEVRAPDVIGKGPSKITMGGSGINSTHHRAISSGGTNHPPDKYEWTMQMPGEPNFLAALDKKFIDTLGKQRKYQGHKLVDLLRALRNKHHHWDDMPDDVKLRVGSVPEGYYNYWDQRFPSLLVGVWHVVKEIGMSEDGRFDRWFRRSTI